MDSAPELTLKKVTVGLLTAGSVYAGYKIVNACHEKSVARADDLKTAQSINSNCRKDFKINQNTVIAFDIHDVIAKYDISKMVKKAVSHPMIAVSSLRHPGLFKLIAEQIKKGTSVQEMFEVIENAYPNNESIKNIAKLAIDISAQLKPIDGTRAIAKKLIANGYSVVFVSNMEPKLFERFIEDFPEFKDCRSFLPTPENQWIKKPSQEYFEMVKLALVEHHHRFGHVDGNVLFIDDRLKNVALAQSCDIPSLVYFSPTQLAADLTEMGANLN